MDPVNPKQKENPASEMEFGKKEYITPHVEKQMHKSRRTLNFPDSCDI
jgi:hypothetical protein